MSAPFNDRGPFAVGEICRVVSSEHCPELIGTEVQIMSGPVPCGNAMLSKEWIGYETNIDLFAPMEHQLRRRPPSDSHERFYVQMWRDMAGKAPQRQVEVA